MARQTISVQDLALPAAAVGLAALVALGVAMAPADLLENLVAASGLPNLVGAAEPPLGGKARAILSFVAGSGAALALLAAYLVLEYRARAARNRPSFGMTEGVPALRRGDAHPDAPARRPIFAAMDLGVVEEPLPPESAPDRRPIARETVPDLLARLENGLERRRMAG